MSGFPYHGSTDMTLEASRMEGNCPAFASCKAVQRCVYQCHKDKEHARYLYQQVEEKFRVGIGPSPQHRAECDCAENYGGQCSWPKCETPLLRVTSVGAEYRFEARIEIIKARVAFYGFLSGVAFTLLGVWLFI